MKLTFPRDRVLTLVEHTKTAEGHKKLYDKETGPGLWLVGDDGVYLMSNSEEWLKTDGEGEGGFVAYANEVNPQTMEFDDWWSAKRESFGGDDGADFLELGAIESSLALGGDLQIEVTPEAISIVTAVKVEKDEPSVKGTRKVSWK